MADREGLYVKICVIIAAITFVIGYCFLEVKVSDTLLKDANIGFNTEKDLFNAFNEAYPDFDINTKNYKLSKVYKNYIIGVQDDEIGVADTAISVGKSKVGRIHSSSRHIIIKGDENYIGICYLSDTLSFLSKKLKVKIKGGDTEFGEEGWWYVISLTDEYYSEDFSTAVNNLKNYEYNYKDHNISEMLSFYYNKNTLDNNLKADNVFFRLIAWCVPILTIVLLGALALDILSRSINGGRGRLFLLLLSSVAFGFIVNAALLSFKPVTIDYKVVETYNVVENWAGSVTADVAGVKTEINLLQHNWVTFLEDESECKTVTVVKVRPKRFWRYFLKWRAVNTTLYLLE